MSSRRVLPILLALALPWGGCLAPVRIAGRIAARRAASREDAAERSVQAAVQAPTTTVVHLWATWCPNSRAELASAGWSRIVNANPGTHFVFVTIWSDLAGAPILREYGVGGQPNVTVVDAVDPSANSADRRRTFLGHALTWVPDTWVYSGGKLRYAFDYGEIHFSMLQQAIDDTNRDWHRDEE